MTTNNVTAHLAVEAMNAAGALVYYRGREGSTTIVELLERAVVGAADKIIERLTFWSEAHA